MAKRFRFSGNSDDLIHVEEIQFSPPGEKPKKPKTEEYNIPPNSSNKGYDIYTFGVSGSWGNFKVHCVYDGTWSFAISLWDEGDELPVGLQSAGPSIEHPYSTSIAFDCADNTKVLPLR